MVVGSVSAAAALVPWARAGLDELGEGKEEAFANCGPFEGEKLG